LQGESVALEFLGDGTVATLVPEGDSLTLRGRLPGTDPVQVRLNTGERELVAFAPVPIEVEEAPCSGPTADGICLQKMASGFRTPAHLTSPPGDDRLMVAQTPTGVVLITLGAAESSSVYTLWNEGLMPKLGVQLQDGLSIARLKAWIDSLGA